jgi:hypothetical protein
VFDNSTNKWKSRLQSLKNLTPDERLAWYIKKIVESNDMQDAIQYAELFGNMANNSLGIDDRGKVSFKYAKLFNDVVNKFRATSPNGLGVWNIPYDNVLINLSTTVNQQDTGIDTGTGNGNNPQQKSAIIPIGLGLFLLSKVF